VGKGLHQAGASSRSRIRGGAEDEGWEQVGGRGRRTGGHASTDAQLHVGEGHGRGETGDRKAWRTEWQKARRRGTRRARLSRTGRRKRACRKGWYRGVKGTAAGEAAVLRWCSWRRQGGCSGRRAESCAASRAPRMLHHEKQNEYDSQRVRHHA